MLSRLLNLVLFGIVAVLFQQYCNINEQLSALQKSFDMYRVNAAKMPGDNSIYNVGSSVWCQGDTHFERVCRFRNLCYSRSMDNFVFLHSKQSIIVGVPENRFNPALLDLAAVHEHNMYHFNYVDLPLFALHTLGSIQFIRGTSVVFARFLPQNLMHTFHDNLLPLFVTLRDNILIPDILNPELHLILMDDAGLSDEFNTGLFDIFSTKKLIHKSDFPFDALVCFENAVVSLSKSSLWYQYGFKKPQGPLPEPALRAHDIHQFTSYIRIKLNLSTTTIHVKNNERYGVLMIRRQNRLIVNSEEVAEALSTELDISMRVLALEDDPISRIISVVSEASLLVGMHGSLMIMSMFLPPTAVVIELYPFALNPDYYTPYATLCKLQGMALVYRSWSNMREENTITHPERSWLLGGINHLGLEEQNEIKSNTLVAEPHLCCNDPQWLYRIYQDTVIDIDSLMTVVADAMTEWHEKYGGSTKGSSGTATSLQPVLYPAPITNIVCLSTSKKTDAPPNLKLTWKPPWNLKYLQPFSIKYELWLQGENSNEYNAYMLTASQFIIKEGLNQSTMYNIWIRNLVNDTIYGPFNSAHVQCST